MRAAATTRAIAQLQNLPPSLQSLNVILLQTALSQSGTQEQDSASPETRLLTSCPRGGSALLTRILDQAPECLVTSRVVLVEDSGPDYRIITGSEITDAAAEASGAETRGGGTTFTALPPPLNFNTVKPIFLVRDPIRIFASWKLHGWSTLQSLVDRFEGLFTSIDSHPTPPYTLVCEKLVRDPEAEIRRVCEYWGIDFNAAMLDYGKDVEDPLELLDAVKEHYGMRSDVPPQAILSNQERYDIECKLGPLYLRTWQPEIDKIRPVLDKATWFAFDLDDTLHEFRRVSMGAIGSVLNSVIQETGSSYPSLTLPTLKSECAKVLMSTASPEFVKDKTSHQYHMHHVRSVFAAFDLTFPDDTIAAWASHYEAVHMETLELKCGVVDLFTTLKSLGKKIVIIGEGPQDMQEWTLEKFGLNQFVDYLATTNELGVGKTDGLFPKVLEAIGAQGSDVVMVGDNYDRDVLPAREAGMFPVHYAEKENFWVGKEADGEATSVKVNTLKKLEFMLKA